MIWFKTMRLIISPALALIRRRSGVNHRDVLLLLLASSWLGAGAAPDAGPARAWLEHDGRSFCLAAPGVEQFRAGWSAVIERGGHQKTLSSEEGVVAAGSVTTNRFVEDDVELLFSFEQVADAPGVRLRAGIRNAGQDSVNLVSVTPVSALFRLDGKPEEWLVTHLDMSAFFASPVTTLRDLQEEPWVHECGSLYRGDGVGFFFGPVGLPVAYVNTRILKESERRISLSMATDMSSVRVAPGETRWGQQVVLLAESPQQALSQWASWIGQSHGARTTLPARSGWNSRNRLEQKGEDTPQVLAVADAVLASEGRLRPDVIQVDADVTAEQLETVADWAPLWAKRIQAAGAGFGLRLDANKGADEERLKNLTNAVRRAVENGITYLKIYYVPVTPAPGGERTNFEKLRDDYIAIRKAAGESTYLLFYDRIPNRAVVGIVDASRTGYDSSRDELRTAMTDVLRGYHLQQRWFTVDNDAYYIGTDIRSINNIAGGWPMARTWMSMVGLSCGTAITSDPWHWDSFRPYWRNVEVMTPPAQERAEVLDLCTSAEWPRLVSHVTRTWGDSTVALLWNPGATERAVTLDFAAAGMDPHKRYAVWSFWDNRYLGVAMGSWTTPALAPSASQHLRFTGLERAPSVPVFIGSSLHIFCGAAEIKQVTASRLGLQIELTDAGAREGDLYIYSPYQPVVHLAEGCVVSGIGSAGENVWRIGLQGRQHGKAQRIKLSLQLPPHRMAWFWLLIACVIASLLFAAWRYVLWMRLERQHLLEEERARIARDLHDEIGSNLSHISILNTVAAKGATDIADARQYCSEAASVARQTIQAFDEILWSVNPKNDTLKSLSHYICKCAEQILSPVPITRHFVLAETLPERPVPPRRRHSLLLAVKEALHNVVKHAEAGRVDIEFEMEGDEFVVRVKDDGRGFPQSEDASCEKGSQGNGIKNMHSRMTELGGTCQMESHPGRGTKITFRLLLE